MNEPPAKRFGLHLRARDREFWGLVWAAGYRRYGDGGMAKWFRDAAREKLERDGLMIPKPTPPPLPH